MKKIIKILALTLVLCFPIFAKADVNKFNVIADENVESNENVVGSSILAGNNVTSNNYVNGIDMLFGNNVHYKSSSDYALIFGNNVNVLGSVKNDGFVFGNLVSFDSNFVIDRDLFIFANTVNLKGKINRDVRIYASSVVLENVIIEGNVTINSSSLEVKPSVEVKGTLSYNDDNEANISSEAVIAETKLTESINKKTTFKDEVYSFLINYAGMIILFLVLSLIVPKLFNYIEKKFENAKAFDMLSTLGFGALSFISIPLAIILIFTTGVGIHLSIFLFIVYILLFFLSTILFGYLLGFIIWKQLIKKETKTFIIGLTGISILSFLSLIPVFDVYLVLINILMSLGIFIRLLRKDQ